MAARNAIVGALRLAWAAALLRHAGQRRGEGRVVTASAYVLAARECAEALASLRSGTDAPPRWPSRLDAIHAASMLPVAIFSHRLRADAFRSGAVSAALALLTSE